MISSYSENLPSILEKKERLRVATQIIKVLKVHLGRLDNLVCLDMGCSSGIISNYLAAYFKQVVGVDVDESAIKIAKRGSIKTNLSFQVMTGENLQIKSETVDVVICNQVYNFVDDPKKLMDEIHRVLKKDGVCFFSGRNKLAIIEPQYSLPLLSWLPEKWGEAYLKLSGKSKIYFGKRYLTYWDLKKLVKKFKMIDLTISILRKPETYGFKSLIKYKNFLKMLPLNFLLPFVPNYIWLLKKER